MEPTDPIQKIEFWREHVRKATLFDGTQGKYAEQNGISASKLSHYKGLFNPKTPSFAKVEPMVEAPAQPPNRSTQTSVPDAVWVATFLREFFK